MRNQSFKLPFGILALLMMVKTINSVNQQKDPNVIIDSPNIEGIPEEIREDYNVNTKILRDSYLDALDHSHSSQDRREGVVKVDINPKILVRRTYDAPVYRPPLSDSYSLPIQQGSFNQNAYGSLQNVYGPPQNNYLPPKINQQGETRGYGVSNFNGYSLPELQIPALPTFDFSWPFAIKLNAFTIAKILLKLVIFKMIVKFIAVICLLLFIPKLEIKKGNKDDSEDDESRGFMPGRTLEQFNPVTAMILKSIDWYRKVNGSLTDDKCQNCHMKRIFEGDTWTEYTDLFNSPMNGKCPPHFR